MAALTYQATVRAEVSLRWEHPLLSSGDFTLGDRYADFRIDTLTANLRWVFWRDATCRGARIRHGIHDSRSCRRRRTPRQPSPTDA